MKRNILFGMALLWTLLASYSLNAQDQQPIAVLSFMNAEDGNAYEEMESKYWKPIHKQMIDDGKLFGWYVYEVVSPYNSKRKYTHMTVNVLPNWNALEAPYAGMEKTMMKVHKNISMKELGELTEESRSIVKQEYWMRQDGVFKEGTSNADVKYVVIDWMDVQPGHNGDYLGMESEVFKPVHKTRVDSGHILSWAVFQKVGGYSELPGVDAATSAAYSSWEDMWDSYPENAWETAHPGKKSSDAYTEIQKHRTMVGSVVYRLVDFVEAEQ